MDGVPMARSDDLIVETLQDELLVYDQRSDQAHSLSATAARVWQACDGKTSTEALRSKLDLDADTVTRALEELEACELLDHGPQLVGVTRRDLTIRAAKIGGVAAAAPLIVSLVAPLPAAAITPTIEFCTQGGLSHGCGEDCDARHCCCCCQQTDEALRPVQCGGDEMCCLPTTQCEAFVFGKKSNCSNKAPCP